MPGSVRRRLGRRPCIPGAASGERLQLRAPCPPAARSSHFSVERPLLHRSALAAMWARLADWVCDACVGEMPSMLWIIRLILCGIGTYPLSKIANWNEPP